MGVNQLLSYLEDRAGSHYRGTVRYDGNSMDVLYLRDDIKQKRIRSDIEKMLDRLRPESSPKEERSFPFGDLRATVRSFDEAILMHFPSGRDRGIVVALEPHAAEDLNTFIGSCEDRLRS